MGKFISDEEMSKLETKQNSSPPMGKNFISDEEMQKLEQPEEAPLTSITEQVTAPAIGYVAVKFVQK